MGMRDAVTEQLQMKALVYCSTSVPMLLLGSGASAYSLCWEMFFSHARQISQRVSKRQSVHTEQLWSDIMKTRGKKFPLLAISLLCKKLQHADVTAVLTF